MKYLVTGATGFIGSAVVRALFRHGHETRALVRPRSTGTRYFDHPEQLEVEPGDLLDQKSLERAVRNVDGVFHVAARYSYWHRNPADTYRVNVDGTGALLSAARAAGVPRVVVTSTVATLRWPGREKLVDETSLAGIDELPGHYKRSKLLAEQAAFGLEAPGFDVVVVNPTAPFGPGDRTPTPTGRIVLEFLKRRFPGYVRTGLNVCDVDDVAEGHLLAFEKGRSGERYILGSENISLRQIYEELSRVTGLRRRPVRVPFFVASSVGMLDSALRGKMLRREPYVPVEGLRVARHPMYVSCEKAVRELGLPQRPASESLLRSAQWFVENGYSKSKLPITGGLDGMSGRASAHE